MSYFSALILTIFIETLVIFLLGFRNKELFKNIVVVNILTNPALNLILNFTIWYFSSFWFGYILFCELVVVIIEWLFLKARLKGQNLPFFLISFTINSISFLSGLWISELTKGEFL